MTHISKLRTVAMFFSFCLAYCVIAFNLYLIQIRHADFFTQLGNNQYHAVVKQTPPRAPILDRTGTHLLAMNKECVSAFIIPSKITMPETLHLFLEQHFPLVQQRLHNNRNKHFMYIKRKLSDDELILIKKANLTDIHLVQEASRYYPNPAAATIVGITDIDNNGAFGMEMQYNTQLAGMPTTYFLEKDARSGRFYFKRETKIAGADGTPMKLTIDSTLQFLVREELNDALERYNAREATTIIMDPDTGDIISMVSVPDFDPQNTQSLIMERVKNKVVTESYELGSVIKVLCALAALEEGVVTPDEIIDCKNTRTTYLDGRRINTVKAHGHLSFTDVIAFSNNIGIATVAKRIGEKLYDHYSNLGFGKKTGIPFPGEAAGFVNPPHKWSKQSIISLSYGYEITGTLLQLATAFCMIAHNGYRVYPRLVMNTEPFKPRDQLYSTKTVETIKKILERTTLHGTAKRAAMSGYTVMGKTGTANTLINGVYDEHKNIYTYAGIIQKDDYQRVIVTFVKEARRPNAYASTIAAPLFERIAEKMIIHDRIV